jgi:hypothetical protein
MIATVSFEIMFDIPQEDTQEADKQHSQERLTEE